MSEMDALSIARLGNEGKIIQKDVENKDCSVITALGRELKTGFECFKKLFPTFGESIFLGRKK